MLADQPLLIDDLDLLRRSILDLENQTSKKAQLWKSIKNSARSAPMNFPWFTPFVALITGEPTDIQNAARVIRTYISKLDPMSFGIGLQFHFWCFAFPHAKWSLYFQWLCTLHAFSPEEEEQIRQQFISYHFINFYYGLRTKPEPECVDNQTLSLAFSNAMVGYIFSQGDQPSEMAERMLRDGLRRLPEVIGDMPASGYSGEGSAYMDCVNGPAIAFSMELLGRITGSHNLLYQSLGKGAGAPINVLKMVAREWMPGGLLLPWDNYGYQLGVRAPLAYAANKTGQRLFSNILENDSIWSYDIGTGWAYDDLVWTLIWWPDHPKDDSEPDRGWYEPEVGGAIVSQDQNLYLAQIWDESAPGIPTRSHANPNAVLLNGYRVPISADGAAVAGGSARFSFPDTRRSVSFLTMGSQDEYNYGDGCGGAHSVVLVDGWEGLRRFTDGAQFNSPPAQPSPKTVMSDAAPFYRERYPDVVAVKRRSSLCCERFFVIEDLVQFTNTHQVTSRFLLRPELQPSSLGIKVRTPEGVTLQLVELLGGDRIITEDVPGFPAKPDGSCVLVDFTRQANQVQRLFIAFISQTLAQAEDLTGFKALADHEGKFTLREAIQQLDHSDIVLSLQLPPHMEAPLPIARRWWYQKTITKKPGEAWIMLPLGLSAPALYINGQELDLSSYRTSLDLIAPRVKIPQSFSGLENFHLVLRTDVPISHYEGGGDGTLGLTGGMRMCYSTQEEVIHHARFTSNRITLQTNLGNYETGYSLMEGSMEGTV